MVYDCTLVLDMGAVCSQCKGTSILFVMFPSCCPIAKTYIVDPLFYNPLF